MANALELSDSDISICPNELPHSPVIAQRTAYRLLRGTSQRLCEIRRERENFEPFDRTAWFS
jgi:hypothetical protein